MFSSMQALALAHLRAEAQQEAGNFRTLRREFPGLVAGKLVESPGKIKRVYVLSPSPLEDDLLELSVHDLTDALVRSVPFVQSSGSQSANLGPVLKRTYSKGKGPGPSRKILGSTLKSFQRLASNAKHSWAPYFGEICRVLSRTRLRSITGELQEVAVPMAHGGALASAVEVIPESKETVFLAVRGCDGCLPGDVPEYCAYLAAVLAEEKYTTSKAGASPAPLPCPLCGEASILYPNALRGAKLNLGNVDRDGAFPRLDVVFAYKAFGLCIDCADLLYIFKNHVMDRFRTSVAGDEALVLPEVLQGPGYSRDLIADFVKWLPPKAQGSASRERDLLEYFAESPTGLLTLHVLWAAFGNDVEDVTGVLTDILPSRLQVLRAESDRANRHDHAAFPDHPLPDGAIDLQLGLLSKLLFKPQSTVRKKRDLDTQVRALRHRLAEALYRSRRLSEREAGLTMDALLNVAASYLEDAEKSADCWGLVHEGASKSGKIYPTLAGWVKHVARFLWFLKELEVWPMSGSSIASFVPRVASLRPYFGPETGLDSPPKAYAFVLGILFGKLLRIQHARGLNVGANALSWLRRLQLSGPELPGLYLRVREKLLSYGSESEAVRNLEEDFAELAVRTGPDIPLNRQDACYYLLLGQSLSAKILPSKTDGEEQKDA